MSDTHAIVRTSPKTTGEKFIGTCTKCGKKGLTIADMGQPCENVRRVSDVDTLFEVLSADYREPPYED